MPRDYAKVLTSFWTHGPGRFFRGDPDAQLLAAYLSTCPSMNMIGLYYLPWTTLLHETGLRDGHAASAIAKITAPGPYQVGLVDRDFDFVFVFDAAAREMQPTLRPRDKRVKNVLKLLKPFEGHPFYMAFLERYDGPFHLNVLATKRRPIAPIGTQESWPTATNFPQNSSENPSNPPPSVQEPHTSVATLDTLGGGKPSTGPLQGSTSPSDRAPITHVNGFEGPPKDHQLGYSATVLPLRRPPEGSSASSNPRLDAPSKPGSGSGSGSGSGTEAGAVGESGCGETGDEVVARLTAVLESFPPDHLDGLDIPAIVERLYGEALSAGTPFALVEISLREWSTKCESAALAETPWDLSKRYSQIFAFFRQARVRRGAMATPLGPPPGPTLRSAPRVQPSESSGYYDEMEGERDGMPLDAPVGLFEQREAK